jgi:AraC-like DNA-binding protein
MIDQSSDSRPACRELEPYISAYHFLEAGPSQPFREVRPPDWGGVGFALSGQWSVAAARSSIDSRMTAAWLIGPSSRAYSLSAGPSSRAVHVAFAPMGWACLTGSAAHPYTDCVVPLTDIHAGATRGLGAPAGLSKHMLTQRLDRFFLKWAVHRPSPLLLQARGLVLDPKLTTAQELANRLGRSTRQTARLARDLFGVPPKLLLRRQRFLRTLELMRMADDGRWVKALDESYYDYSHFIRDFRRFMDRTPTQHRALAAGSCPIFPIRPASRRP